MIHRLVWHVFLQHDLCNFLQWFLTLFDFFADIARTKVQGQEMLPNKRSKEIFINEDVATCKAKSATIHTTGGKGNGKGNGQTTKSSEVNSNSEWVYVTHLRKSKAMGNTLILSHSSPIFRITDYFWPREFIRTPRGCMILLGSECLILLLL